MNLGGPGAANQRDQLAHRRAAHDRIVDHGHAAAGENAAHRVELYAHVPVAVGLPRLDEGPSDVVVADQAQLEAYPRGLAVAEGDRVARVRNGDHDIGVGAVLLGQPAAEPAPHAVDIRAEDAAVGAREVDELEDAARKRIGRRGEAHAPRLPGPEREYLARLDLALVRGAEDIEGAALRGDDPGRAEPPQAQGPEPARVAGGDDPAGQQKNQSVRPAQCAKRLGDHTLYVALPAARDQMQDQFAVHRAAEDRAVGLERIAQFDGVDDVPVMSQRDPADPAIDEQRLNVGRMRQAGGRVAVVADGDVPGEPLEYLGTEDLGYQPHRLVFVHSSAVIGYDPGALLSAVLQGIKAQVGHQRRLVAAVDSEYRAFLPHVRPPPSSPPTAATPITSQRW